LELITAIPYIKESGFASIFLNAAHGPRSNITDSSFILLLGWPEPQWLGPFFVLCDRPHPWASQAGQIGLDEEAVSPNFVYFDVETQKSLHQVGGHGRVHELKVSLGVTYSARDREYQIFLEDETGRLIDDLWRADLVVGYNIIGFDYRVLSAYDIRDLSQLPTLDMMAELEKAAGFRPKMESVAMATLGIGKTADGTDALRWFQEGRMEEIAEYCCYDVKVTRLLHEYGRQHGCLFCFDRAGDRRLKFDVSWA